MHGEAEMNDPNRDDESGYPLAPFSGSAATRVLTAGHEGVTCWRLAAGGWRLAAGGWRLAAGGWRLAAGGWPMLRPRFGHEGPGMAPPALPPAFLPA